MARIEPYAAAGVYDPPIYAQAVKVSGAQTILFIAGQVAYTADGGAAHAGDFKGQARAALQCLKAQIEAGGGTMANIVKVNTYLTDIRQREAAYRVIGRHLKGVFPVSTGVVVSALARPEWLVEVEATAVIPAERTQPA